MKITAIYERDPNSDWWVVRTVELPWAFSQGETIDEARAMLKDCIQLMLLDLRETAEAQRTPDMMVEMLDITA